MDFRSVVGAIVMSLDLALWLNTHRQNVLKR
jgi:hypothetical protein